MRRVRVRPLKDYAELTACVELQKKTWGPQFDDVVSAALMLVGQKIGGIAAGAFDEDEDLIAIIFGLTGIRNGGRIHWSHMLAVEPQHQGKGLGRLLKLYQRGRMLDLDIHEIYWTFDPLEARNAHFNLNVLGAHVDDYVLDMYGSGESSPLHRGLGTDRFVVRWDLDEMPDALAQEYESIEWLDGVASARVPFSSGGAGPLAEIQDGSAALVEIPPNIQQLKAADPDAASDWRTATRAAFTKHLSEGRAITGFARRPTGECVYILQHR